MKENERKRESILLNAFMGLFIIVLISFFTYTQITFSHIEEYEAKTVVAHFADCEIQGDRSPVLIISFLDHDDLTVRWKPLRVTENLNSLTEGAELQMQVHPRSRCVMSIHYGDRVLYDFNDSVKELDMEKKAFLTMGLVIFALFILLFFMSKEGHKTIKHLKRKIQKLKKRNIEQRREHN